jgi:CRISPR-associated exonuclease Cas4
MEESPLVPLPSGPFSRASAVPTFDIRNMEPFYPLRVNDLKQWDYCPRIVFYNTVMPVTRKSTIKMERGKEIEIKLDALEARRTLRRYRLAEGERRFHVWLNSPVLGMSGKLDLLIVTPEACYPVDFKYTRDRPRRNHIMQLAAYALLVEDAMRVPVPMAFVYLTPSDQLVRINVTDRLKELVLARLATIRQMVQEAILPEPTPARARCEECEFRNYCGDIF